MASTREAAAEIKVAILKAFGPPSAGKQLTKEAVVGATGIEAGKVNHHIWGLVQEGKLAIVGSERGEGKRGRAASVYAKVATNGAGEAA